MRASVPFRRPARRAVPAVALLVLMLAAPAVARAGEAGRHPESTIFHSGDEARDFSWALVDPEGNTTMEDNRDGGSREAVTDLARDAGQRLFWFRLDREDWVVTDPRLVQRADDVTEPVRRIGREQGRLGRQQGEIGRQQGEIGREQGRLGVREGAIGAREGALAARLAARELADDRDEDADRERAEIRSEMRALREERRALRREADQAGMSELGRRQGELGRRQGELGRRQAELGREMRHALEDARARLRELAREAIERRVARRVGEEGEEE